MSGLGWRFDTQPRGNILASVRLSFTAKVQTLLQGIWLQRLLSTSWLTAPLRKGSQDIWHRVSIQYECMSTCHRVVSCVCLDIIFVCVNYVKYDLNRSSSGVQDVLDTVSSTFYPAGGEKGGTLASNQQAANLSDRRRVESSRVHLKLPAVVYCVCVLLCMHEECVVCRYFVPMCWTVCWTATHGKSFCCAPIGQYQPEAPVFRS